MEKIKNFFQFINKGTCLDFEEKVGELLKNLPKLPVEVTNLMVNFGPYLVLLGGILNFLTIFSLFSVNSFLFNFGWLAGATIFPYYHIYVIGIAVSGLMLIVAFGELQAKTIFGWRLVFWSLNLSCLALFFSLNILSGLVGVLLSWYFLSQIKQNYS